MILVAVLTGMIMVTLVLIISSRCFYCDDDGLPIWADDGDDGGDGDDDCDGDYYVSGAL